MIEQDIDAREQGYTMLFELNLVCLLYSYYLKPILPDNYLKSEQIMLIYPKCSQYKSKPKGKYELFYTISTVFCTILDLL